MQAFDRVGGINDPSYCRREGKEGDHLPLTCTGFRTSRNLRQWLPLTKRS
jgi:hypothetical protein